MAEVLKRIPWHVYAAVFTAIGLGIAGFIVPPTGVIDPSVLKYVAELMGGISAIEVILNLKGYIEAGAKARIEHGETVVTLEGKNQHTKENG